MTNKTTAKTIIEVISEITGLEEAEVTLDSDLQEDLAIDMINTFPTIIRHINEALNEQLPLRDSDFKTDLKHADTVLELINIIESEIEY